jgi:hypothetical protein
MAKKKENKLPLAWLIAIPGVILSAIGAVIFWFVKKKKD